MATAAVRAAFGLTGEPVPLAGGQGRSIRIGDAVLKPTEDRAEAEWAGELFAGLAPAPGVRLPEPVRAATGYVVDGWAAYRHATGGPGPSGRWAQLLAAGRAFHAALAGAARPALLDRRDHAWAVADRVARGEAEVALRPDARVLVERLQAQCEPVRLPAQLVHGDLTGNVLFAEGLPPAVIDFSPYWRPTGYADAIVVADGLLCHRAGQDLIALGTPGPEGRQLLLRALLFRLVTWGILGPLPEGEADRFERALALLRAPALRRPPRP